MNPPGSFSNFDDDFWEAKFGVKGEGRDMLAGRSILLGKSEKELGIF